MEHCSLIRKSLLSSLCVYQSPGLRQKEQPGMCMHVLWGKLWGSTCTCVCFIQIGARQACIIFQWMTVRVRAQKGLNGFTFVPYHLLSTDACLIKREQHAREQKAQRMVMCWTKEAAAKSSTDIVLRVQDRCWNGMQRDTMREKCWLWEQC